MTAKSFASLLLGGFLCASVLPPAAYPAEGNWFTRTAKKFFSRNADTRAPSAAVPGPSLSSAPVAASEKPPARPDAGKTKEAAGTVPAGSFLHTPTPRYKLRHPKARFIDDDSEEMRTLTSDGYDGPDLSEERTVYEEHLMRKFPMPQPRVPEPPRTPPTPDRYAPPPRPADDSD